MSRGFVAGLMVVFTGSILAFHLVIKQAPDEDYLSMVEEMHETTSTWIGAYPPDFEVELIDGRTFRLSDAIGSKIVILNFFATWCGPCRSELPELERFASEHPDDVLMVGIDIKEPVEDVRRFTLKKGVTYPIAVDPNGRTAALYEVSNLPTTIVVGFDGRVLLHDSGAIKNAEVAFGTLLDGQLEVRNAIGVMTPEEFRIASSEAGHPSGRTPEGAETIQLEGRALDLAARIRCPSCGQPLLECEGKVAEQLRARLADLDVDAMTDAQVLEALFLLPESGP